MSLMEVRNVAHGLGKNDSPVKVLFDVLTINSLGSAFFFSWPVERNTMALKVLLVVLS